MPAMVHYVAQDKYFMNKDKYQAEEEMMGGMMKCVPVNMHGRPVPTSKGSDQNAQDKIDAINKQMGCCD